MFLLVVQTASNPPTVSGLLVSKPPRAASRAFHRLLGVGDSHAHGAGGALDHAHRSLDAGGVEVFTVNTEKAQKLLPRLPLTLMPVTQQQCLQQGMEYAAAAPKGRDAFWALYREKGFDAVVQKYGKLTLEKKLIYHVIVPVCKKLGIYQLAAKIYLKK